MIHAAYSSIHKTMQHRHGVTPSATTIELFIDEMQEAQLRLIGKILATICISVITVTGYTDGDIAAGSIAAIWVVTIPSIVEAWVIAKKRQAEQDY